MSTHIKVTTLNSFTLLLPIEKIGVAYTPDKDVYVFHLGEGEEEGWVVTEPLEYFEEKLL